MDSWVVPAIITAVPLLVAGIKKLVGPKTWLLPIIAGLLGVAADFAATYIVNKPATPTVGMILGLAGVGLRELVDQLKQAAK